MARLHPYGNPSHYPSVQWEIDRPEVRLELDPRKKPYWMPLATGRMIGLDKGRTWRWTARFSKPGGNHHRYKVLGYTDDTPVFNSRYLRLPFDVASDLADEWFSQFDDGLDPRPIQERHGSPPDRMTSGPYSVSHAVIDYLWHLHGRGGDWRREQSIFLRHVIPDLGATDLAKLEARDVERWKRNLLLKPRCLPDGAIARDKAFWFKVADAESMRRRRKTINTYISVLRRALDHAFTNGHAASDQPWRSVKGFQNVDPRRRERLYNADITALLNVASPQFTKLMRGLLHTGARGVELAGAKVKDYAPRSQKLRVTDGKYGTVRSIILDTDGAGFFDGLSRGRSPEEGLFQRAGNRLWSSSSMQWAFAGAKENAGVNSALTLRSFRNTYGTRAALAGMPIRFLAQQLGHRKIATTEKYYVQFEESEVDQHIRHYLENLATG